MYWAVCAFDVFPRDIFIDINFCIISFLSIPKCIYFISFVQSNWLKEFAHVLQHMHIHTCTYTGCLCSTLLSASYPYLVLAQHVLQYREW